MLPELGGPVDEPAPARTRAHTPAPAREKKPSAKKPGKSDDAFDAFWAVYPRKADKKKARQAWTRAIRDADPKTIIAGDVRGGDVVELGFDGKNFTFKTL